jgi:hypothetical protein
VIDRGGGLDPLDVDVDNVRRSDATYAQRPPDPDNISRRDQNVRPSPTGTFVS